MLIRTVVVTPFSQNARICVDEKTREALVIDPGGDVEKLLAALTYQDEPLQVRAVFLTHAHIDHAGGVEALRRALEKRGPKPELLAHPGERELRAHVSASALMFGLDPADYENAPEPDRYVNEGDEILVGTTAGKLLFTPGHSPGHLSLYFPEDKVLIAGDVIFQGSIGRTDLPGGNHETLLRSVREKIFTLPEDVKILCGHGPDTTVGHEKRTNPFFR